MNSLKPIIGVTGPDNGGLSAWLFTRFAVWRAGGKAVRITPSQPVDSKELDGLILGGGADIHPRRYTQVFDTDEITSKKPGKGVKNLFLFLFRLVCYPLLLFVRKLFSAASHGRDYDRDELEFPLLEQALEKKIPVLGICRGAQLINVHCGGNLHRDLKNFYNEIPQLYTIWPQKKVAVIPGSKLHSIVGRSMLEVNALHRQAVNHLAADIRPVAREPNGVIQGIEHTRYPFLIGVQWHPEYLPQVPEQQRLFQQLIKQAALSYI